MRFDLYRNTTELNFKDQVDKLAEFDIDYVKCRVEKITEKKSENEAVFYYYPGCHVYIRLVRDPANVLVSTFFPALVVGVFIVGA